MLSWPSRLLKANYGVDYGGSALASKYGFQDVIGQSKYATSAFLPCALEFTDKVERITDFAALHDYPVVVKPDKGFVGKGIFIIKSAADIEATRPALTVDYMVQAFVPGVIEFGLFYARLN